MKDAAAIVPCAPCVKTKRRKMSHIFSCFYEKKSVCRTCWCSGTAGILTFRSCMQILHVMGERGNFSWQSTHTKRPAPRGDRSHGINFLAWCCYRAMQNTHTKTACVQLLLLLSDMGKCLVILISRHEFIHAKWAFRKGEISYGCGGGT